MISVDEAGLFGTVIPEGCSYVAFEMEVTNKNGEVDLERGEEYASNIFNAVFGDHTPYFFNGNLKNLSLIHICRYGIMYRPSLTNPAMTFGSLRSFFVG